MRLSGRKKPVIITNYYNKTVLLPLCDNKCDWNKQKSDINCLTKKVNEAHDFVIGQPDLKSKPD
jgi:hypothetical protein